MTNPKMTLVDWLDDLCVRFIVNLPNEELQSVERICFQIEEAQWFYEDFIRPLDPNSLPSMHLRKFSQLMFQHCPLFSAYSEELHQQAYEQFLAYKTRVPVRGAIMLNEDMTHAVLVKGWKKGAKWSFPRGKINKEEADLDCAVREVWEETGYDVRKAGLVLLEADMKSITVTMREQSMMLYVFRGVPMDTYFEPQTRKEISKIDWYRLNDLPAMRRKNQVPQQHVGQDAYKESNFYMVAPFLGPLRGWIKMQQKLDRQRVRSSARLAPPGGMPITDDEELQGDMYETPAEESAPITAPQTDDTFADLVARLGHRASDALPEVSAQSEPAQPIDPAAELKRMLSVGAGMQPRPAEAHGMPTPGTQPPVNPLLALFQQGNKPASPHSTLPRTPFDQIMPPPVQPHSPHGQHHPRPPQFNNMPPPPFPFPPHQGMPFHGPQPPFHNGMHAQVPPQFMPPPQHQHNAMFQSPQQMPIQQAPQPFQQSNEGHVVQPQSFPAPQSQSFGVHGAGPVIPPASKLPAPKLNAHTMGLLNSFKISDEQASGPESSQATVHAQSPQPTPRIQQHLVPQHQPNELASPHFLSPPLNIQPAQPQPRSAHQDSLLTLFRNSSPVPLPEPEPAELSAHPLTPGNVSARPVLNTNQSLLDLFGAQPKPAGITSATVRGPVNAPDFATMKKNTLPIGGSSRGPSPSTFVPQQILKREPSVPQSHSHVQVGGRNGSTSNTPEVINPPQEAFKPQILKRPQENVLPQPQENVLPQPQENVMPAPRPAQTAHAKGLLDMFKSPSPQPPPAPAPTAHAKGLLDMFKSPSPQPPPAPAPTAHAKGLLDMFKSPSPQPPATQPTVPSTRSPALLATQGMPSTRSPALSATQQSFDRRESFPSEQKTNLLALFSKPSPQPDGRRIPAPLQQTRSPIPSARSPLPPTPKTTMPGLTSPVSPLPEKSSQTTSPADFTSRSRISSIGDCGTPSIVVPPTSHPASMGQSSDQFQGRRSVGGLSGPSRSGTDGKSPVDKTFLLGFLEDVARRGR
jgi:mRNA-decapping enzyme subunit 2